jgi:hypothetical protein
MSATATDILGVQTYNVAASLNGSATMNASINTIVVQLSAALNGVGIGGFNITEIVNVSSTLAGTGTISANVDALILSVTANLNGTGTINARIRVVPPSGIIGSSGYIHLPWWVKRDL